MARAMHVELPERFALQDFIEKLNYSPAVAARIEALKEEVLLSDTARKFSSGLWGRAKTALVRYADVANVRKRESSGATAQVILELKTGARVAVPAIFDGYEDAARTIANAV